MNIRNHAITAQAPGKERAPFLKGALPFYEASQPRLNPAAYLAPASLRDLTRREKSFWVGYFFFFFFFAAFFFILLFRIGFDFLPALRALFLRRTGIDTSSDPVTAG
ncbi:MAG: hypothetical protein ACREQB_00810 [Candidatus Binataceae bacterium]